MSPAGPLLRIEQEVAYRRETVFDAWVSPELLAEWFAPPGCTLFIARLDARTGGGYHWCVRNPAFGDCWTTGVYTEVLRPERLVFTSVIADAEGFPRSASSQGHDPDWPDETTIRVIFKELAGGTLVTLEQSVSAALAQRTGAHPSWLGMLSRLSQLLENHSS